MGLASTCREVLFEEAAPLRLERGGSLAPVEVAYETYGRLDPDAANCVVIHHALTGDANAAGHHGNPEWPGWWDNMIGPGKPVDTDRYFVVSSNLLGGCQGTTGPGSLDPATGRPYGLRFPQFTVRDLVEVQRALLRRLGVERPLAAMGGSLGGMQALQWALDHPGELRAALLLCASGRLSDQNIAFSAVARRAIMTDPDFQGGDYYGTGRVPERGLAVARMMAHITYLSEESMRRRFDRQHTDGGPRYDMGVDFEVERYLHHQGDSFLRRFDANTYLYLTRVMDYFEPFADDGVPGRLPAVDTRFLVVSFSTDWRFDASHSRGIVEGLAGAAGPVTHRDVASPHGHDSFLLHVPEYHGLVDAFLTDAYRAAVS